MTCARSASTLIRSVAGADPRQAVSGISGAVQFLLFTGSTLGAMDRWLLASPRQFLERLVASLLDGNDSLYFPMTSLEGC